MRTAHILHRHGTWSGAAAPCALDHAARLVRRKRLTTDDGKPFVVDLAQTVSLDDGDALELDDGDRVVIRAAPEPVLVVTGDLARFAWHIGNRHAPCQIRADRLIVAADPVIADMLSRLGASATRAMLPFTPEGGAYGHGRTHGH